MWPFGNQYDVWVVDYKVVIRENLNYNRSRVTVLGSILIAFTALGIFTDEHALPAGVFVIAVEAGLVIGLYLSRQPKAIIEIDSERKTIRVRDKYDINLNNVISVKISELNDSSGYTFDYLALVHNSETETGIYKVLKADLSDDEIHRIAGIIADKLGLELIIEVEPFSFRKFLSLKNDKETLEKKEIVY